MDEIPVYVLSHISASEGEVLYHKRLTRNIAIYKNKKREIRKHFLVTVNNMVLLDYFTFPLKTTEHYREKDVIPIADIEAISCEMKKLFIAKRPFIQIRTEKDVFEIVFSSFGNYAAEMQEIADLVKRLNAKIEITFNLAEMPWTSIV